MRLFRTNKKSQLTDTEIIALYKSTGDKKLVGILFDRHSHLVYGICYKYLRNEEKCKDAVLTIFEKLFADLLKYEVSNFSSWIHSVSRNYCFAFLNKENGRRGIEEIPELIEENENDNEVKLFTEKNLLHLNGALNSINTEQKKCIEMFYLENNSYNEISTATGFTINQVKSYIQNGKRNLKIYLEKNIEHE
ncbi:MAG: RNA polymerase sigma factor [Bacteroidia bacterium]